MMSKKKDPVRPWGIFEDIFRKPEKGAEAKKAEDADEEEAESMDDLDELILLQFEDDPQAR